MSWGHGRTETWGQYIVIHPAAGLVGVRMIEAFDGYVEARVGFAACQDLLRELH